MFIIFLFTYFYAACAQRAFMDEIIFGGGITWFIFYYYVRELTFPLKFSLLNFLFENFFIYFALTQLFRNNFFFYIYFAIHVSLENKKEFVSIPYPVLGGLRNVKRGMVDSVFQIKIIPTRGDSSQ